ncbi:MAG TPA: DUF3037 domain-containing protein [Actinomycetota bacterium]|nr:DUF3037 domain-containing protein [Actinomycetota bacterium]
MRFVYSVVRFVPDPAREEFVNVGVIVGSEELGRWEVRQVENPRRARALDDRGVLRAAWDFLDAVGRVVDDFHRSQETLWEPEVEPSTQWLEQLRREYRNIVQLSPPRPLAAADLDSAVETVFSELVVDPESRRLRFEKKHRALREVRRLYMQHGLVKNKTFFERTVLRSAYHEERLDFVAVNSVPRQLVQTWSFDVPDQESLAEQVKAWGWTLGRLREAGGELEIPDRILPVERDIDVGIVYVPSFHGHARTLEEARYIADHVNAWMVDVSDEKELEARITHGGEFSLA